MKLFAVSLTFAVTAIILAAPARAEMHLGNYELHIQGRYDFHTWIWAIVAPRSGECPSGCVHVAALPQPVAKAFEWQADAQPNNGHYVMAVDDPFGLRCGDIYYGPVIPTHDVYTWDATTQSGILNSSFDTNCDGAPGGSYAYPFTLTRM